MPLSSTSSSFTLIFSWSVHNKVLSFDFLQQKQIAIERVNWSFVEARQRTIIWFLFLLESFLLSLLDCSFLMAIFNWFANFDLFWSDRGIKIMVINMCQWVQLTFQVPEELAMNYDQKSQEVDSKNKENESLSEQLSEKLNSLNNIEVHFHPIPTWFLLRLNRSAL